MRRKFSFLVALIVVCSSALSAQSAAGSKSILESGVYQMKLNAARQKFDEEAYVGALNLYQELYEGNKTDANLNFRIGECYLALNEFDNALQFLIKARELGGNVDKSFLFVLAQAYHRNGKFDQAINSFNEFKNSDKASKEDKEEADRFIKQCIAGKKMMNKPVKNEIKNAGISINSKYDDYACSITADGKVIYFTSRRPETIGGQVDQNDGKFYEDIYFAKWDADKRYWNAAKQLPGKLNTNFHEAVLSISPDGNQIFIYKNIPKETQSGDIYTSKKNSTGVFANSKSVSDLINTSYFETSASITEDGNYLYFASERKGGFGQTDIYRSRKVSATQWAEPENLGNVINTPNEELSVFISGDGKTLYFSSNRAGSMGGLDIFKSEQKEGVWSEPENLGYPINGLGDDLHFTISSDLTAYYSTVKSDGFGGRDIYLIDFKEGIIPGTAIVAEDVLMATVKQEPVAPAAAPDALNVRLLAKIDSLQLEIKGMRNELSEVKALLNKQSNIQAPPVVTEAKANPTVSAPIAKREPAETVKAVEQSGVFEDFERPSKGYYLVLASTKDKDVAIRNAEKYKEDGLDVFIFKIERDSWYYVSLKKRYENVKEAKNEVFSFRKRKYSGAWYFYVD